MNFTRPILMAVLTEGVDEGKEGIRICDPGCGSSVSAGRANAFDFKYVIACGFADEDQQLGNIAGVDCPRTAAWRNRVTPHPEQFAVQSIVTGALQRNL